MPDRPSGPPMRRQLAFAAAAVSSLIVLAFVVPLGLLVRTLAEDRALANAERRAETLVPVLATVASRDELDRVVAGLAAGGDGPLGVYLADDTVLGTPVDGAADNLVLARRGRAFVADTPSVQVLQPVVGPDGATDVIVVGVPDDQLHRGVAGSWAVLVGLAVSLVLLAVVVADRLGRSIVSPVNRLAETADRLGEGDLAARAELVGPAEIVEVAATLNQLAERIEDLLAAEREQLADLSHRLRTPVTALRLDADALPEGEDKERVVADVDELARALDRLIGDARRTTREPAGPAVADLARVTADRVAFWSVLAEDQERTCAVDVPGAPCPVAVHADELEVLIDALLGNVFAHTPEGTGFAVAVHPDGDGSTLVVEDAGPGLPGDEVLERGRSGGGSTGLGLDIVRRTAERSGGTLALGRSDLGGARVAITFPPAGPGADDSRGGHPDG